MRSQLSGRRAASAGTQNQLPTLQFRPRLLRTPTWTLPPTSSQNTPLASAASDTALLDARKCAILVKLRRRRCRLPTASTPRPLLPVGLTQARGIAGLVVLAGKGSRTGPPDWTTFPGKLCGVSFCFHRIGGKMASLFVSRGPISTGCRRVLKPSSQYEVVQEAIRERGRGGETAEGRGERREGGTRGCGGERCLPVSRVRSEELGRWSGGDS